MIAVANQMVSELHHVVVDNMAGNRIVSEPKAKQVACAMAWELNSETGTDAFQVAYVKRDGSLILR